MRGFDSAYCYGPYEGVLRELVHVFKYGRVRTLAAPLGARLLEALPAEEAFDLIVPVPLHWRRRWQRGFNQSELLGKEISRHIGIPLANVLRRGRATATQAGLSNTARRSNVRTAFQGRRFAESLVRGKRVLLIDDVMTTGSTAAACAVALKKAGAAHVTLLTAARVDRRFEVEPVAVQSGRREETN